MFELPCIEDLLLEGPGQRQIYKSRPSVFSGCPRFKMLALRVDFRREILPSFFYHACLFSFQLYFSAYHYWSFSLFSLWYCDSYVTLCFAWFGSVILVSSLTSVCFTPFAWFGIVVLTVRILGKIVFMPFLLFYCVLPNLAVYLEPRSGFRFDICYGIWFSVCIVHSPFLCYSTFFLLTFLFYFVL